MLRRLVAPQRHQVVGHRHAAGLVLGLLRERRLQRGERLLV
jgi:hypothetical protein